MAERPKEFPSTEETLQHSAYPNTIWDLKPHGKGLFAAAKGRGGPVRIAWEIHGSGPKRLVFITGLGVLKTSWQRQTLYFGHEHGDEYSMLILDNRGIGESDKPITRYSTSEMARDVLEVVDHVGWTQERELHLVGISLGGMVAQELACLVPQRLRSLSLLCSTASVSNRKPMRTTIIERMGMLIPKGEAQATLDSARVLFSDEWLLAPDMDRLPSPKISTQHVGPAAGTVDGEYLHFDNNFQRYQAMDLLKKRTPGLFSKPTFFCQLIAAGWHHKSEEQLSAMADQVGRDRILVLHGTEDRMISPPNGERLIEMIKPGKGLVIQGMGHAPIVDRPDWLHKLLAGHFEEWK